MINQFREGWICPRCRKSLAPWVASCDCKEDHTRNYDLSTKYTLMCSCDKTTGVNPDCPLHGRNRVTVTYTMD